MKILSFLLVVLILASAIQAVAQDLEPRAFSPAPIGMNFGLVAYTYGTGNVFFDASLPVEEAKGTLQSVTLAYLRTINVFGATGKLAAVVPIASGDYEGLWLDEPASAFRRGLADPMINLAVNFVGAPASTLREMATYHESTVVGAAFLVKVPLGQYDPEKLINLGSNRWSFRGRLGGSQRVGRWNFELIGELWAFTENSEAFGANTISQDPILSIQTNVVYRFRRGFWGAAGFGYGEGGQTEVSGVEKDTNQINKRFGLTLVFPIGTRHSLKAAYLNSLSTRIGADFDSFTFGWQYRWGGGV